MQSAAQNREDAMFHTAFVEVANAITRGLWWPRAAKKGRPGTRQWHPNGAPNKNCGQWSRDQSGLAELGSLALEVAKIRSAIFSAIDEATRRAPDSSLHVGSILQAASTKLGATERQLPPHE